MKQIDKQYLIHPHMGAPRMHTWLTEDMGYRISKNRVDRLYYRVMGLRAIMLGPHTSKRGKPPCLPIPAPRLKGDTCQSSVGSRHHVYSHVEGIYVHVCNY